LLVIAKDEFEGACEAD